MSKSTQSRLLTVVALGIFVATGIAQTPGSGGRNGPPGDAVVGKVSSISKDSLVIVPLTGGDPVTVKVNDSTRVNKDRQPAQMDDIKAGDVIFARGELSNGVMSARMVGVVNPQMVERIQEGGGIGFGPGTGRGGDAGFNREDWGKRLIAGEVKAINETRLTIARPDGQTQDIEVDENTSFKRGKESITLPEVKVGDFVRGQGELKNNVFVPKELIVGRPQMRMMGGPDGASPAGPVPDKPPAQATPKN